MRWGHDFLRIRREIIKPLGPMGKIQISKGEPIKTINYTVCCLFPIIYLCQNLVEVVIAWEWEEYGKKFELGRALIFGKRVMTPWASKNPKMSAHSLMHPRFCLPHVFGAPGHSHSCELSQESKVSCVYPFTFLVVNSNVFQAGK